MSVATNSVCKFTISNYFDRVTLSRNEEFKLRLVNKMKCRRK
jgi:hypothetical protein